RPERLPDSDGNPGGEHLPSRHATTTDHLRPSLARTVFAGSPPVRRLCSQLDLATRGWRRRAARMHDVAKADAALIGIIPGLHRCVFVAIARVRAGAH